MNKKLYNMAKAKQRERAIDDGYYDGRFRTKVVEDKKKKAERLASKRGRNKNYFTDDDQ